MTQDKIDIGMYFKNIIQTRKMTIKGVAELANMVTPTISNKMNRNAYDSRFKMTAEEMIKLAQVLDIDLNDLKGNVQSETELRLNRITAEELLFLAEVYNLDLNKLKEKYRND